MTLPVPATPLTADDELCRAIVEDLRTDSYLNVLLFPDWAASVDPMDLRVYKANVELPESPPLRGALPRVIVEATMYPFRTEQEQSSPNLGEVMVYTHVLVPKDREDTGSIIDAYLQRRLVSTAYSSARIITASLSLDGQRRIGRIGAFDDAWEFVTQYRSPLVGVIA
jgi:hypothetical protein